MIKWQVFNKSTAFIAWAFVGLFIGVFVLATIDRTRVQTETMLIVPGSVQSESWQSVQQSLISDLHGESLFQEFSANNSAYINLAALTPALPTPPETPTTDTTENNEIGGSETITEPSITETPDYPAQESLPETTTGVPEEVAPAVEMPADLPAADITTPAVEAPADLPAPEVTVPAETTENVSEPVSSNGIWGVFTESTGSWPLLQETTITYVTTTEPISSTPVDPVVSEEAALEQAPAEPALSNYSEEEQISDAQPPEGAPAETETNENVPGGDLTNEVVEEVLIETEEEYTTTTEVVEVEPTEVSFSPLTVCAEQSPCEMYPLVFNQFMLPEFESDQFLSNVTVRLSLAAQAQNDGTPQYIVIDYRYANDAPWRAGTLINIADETSNSLNGGYYLISLDQPLRQADLATLEVRVSYVGDIASLKRAYVEALWLEVAAATFYEEGDPHYGTDALRSDRTLIEPRFHSIATRNVDFGAGDLPKFVMSYSPQQSTLRRLATALISENVYQVEAVRVINSDGAVVDMPLAVRKHDDTTWTIEFTKQPQKFLPGRYLLEVVVNENDTRFIDSFEFYWGVLAVNTTRDRYYPGDRVTFNLAALTDEGDTICDAILELTVITADNYFHTVPVEQSGFCGKNNVTDMPDYLAHFSETTALGEYTIQLRHFNTNGELVHQIENSFLVEEFIPFEIERTAPTRIFPPAPYDVRINVKANRTFTGDVVELVPRGFIITEAGDALIETRADATAIIWREVVMSEGEERIFSYRFDAPNISPYLFLLGPLSLDGHQELRQWQIASDAIAAAGWFVGTRTVAGTNLNQAASALQWSTSSVDNFYFTHSTSSASQEVTIRQPGDYFIAVNVPHQRTDANARGTRIGIEVRLNGVALPEGLGRSGYISNQLTHSESSSHVFFMLEDAAVNDVVTVNVQGLTTINAADIVNVSGQASMYIEYLAHNVGVFAATTTQTTNSTNLNQLTEFPFTWTEVRQDTGFVHSNSVNPQQVILSNPGVYHVQVSIPLTTTADNTNILGRILLNGVQVDGGRFNQGYAQLPTTESDPDSSIHFSGIVVATTTNQLLSVTAFREGAVGTVTVPAGAVGTLLVRRLPATEIIALRGNNLVGGTNWNPAAAAAIQWTAQDARDAAIFTHSTTTNNHQITITSPGDYYLSFNNALTGVVTRANSRIQVLRNGVPVSGARTQSNYIRNLGGHNEASGALVFILENVQVNDVITVTTAQEAAAGTLDDTTAASLLLWRKQEFNQRPNAPSMFNAPFDNIRFASTTPHFDFSANDPDGSSNIIYQFSISTSSDFAASTTYDSITSAQFFNTASSTDTSPFTEGDRIRFQLPSAGALIDGVTYYWRVRASDVTGSGQFGDWSTTQSLTVDLAQATPSWYQSFTGQFVSNTLIGTVSSGGDEVRVDATPSSEVLIAYGEGTVQTPRYRFWNGTSWGTELNALSVGGTINWVQTAAGIGRDEYLLATISSNNAANVQVYNAGTGSWGNLVTLSNSLSLTHRGVAVAYESISGDGMAVACAGTDLAFRTWNGSVWSATSTVVSTSLNACNFVELAADPTSDEIMLVTRDTGSQYEAIVWNGSTWVESRVLGSASAVGREGIAVEYERSGDQAIIVVSNGALSSIIYTTWNGSEFSLNTTQAIGDDFEFGRLVADTDSDQMTLCYIDFDSDIGVLRWNGGVWAPFVELDISGNANTGRPVDCIFETLAGRTDSVITTYSDTAALRYRAATSSNVWEPEISVSNILDSFWVRTVRAGDGTVITAALDDVRDVLETSAWNGSAWSAKNTLETSPSSVLAVPFEMFDLAAKRFQYSEGVVRTQPINFGKVPNQPTWGDISFTTAEPAGTDVRVRVRFTNFTTCDTYVPNGVLPGNGAGFDVSQSPINLTGLATSTYSQICLEATLTTLGTQSATLNEWTLSWVRQPKLSQSNYRWYGNGSFLTPTDPWPIGPVGLGENIPMSPVTAISLNEVTRLRLAVQSKNVTLPALSQAFKLQYAEGFTCSPGLQWNDVGGPASTTALWRGFNNAIVGSDWYNTNWTRRIKITVQHTVVEADLTDFPVYVNLADLPAGFFGAVRSDGGDIRVTQADGISEVPFELVSINTGARTGELHFRGNLASTTDTEFFIYYNNPTATGYSASAPFGSRNVWTNGFEAVYHLGTDPSSTILDSTSNARHLTPLGGLGPSNSVAGVLGNGIDLDGINDRLTNAGFAWTATPVTVTAWSNVATSEVQNSNLFGFTAAGSERLATHAPWGDNVIYWDYGTCCASPGRISTSYAPYLNKWTHLGLVSQGTGGSFMGIYLDGSLVTSITTADDPNVTLTGFSLGSTDPSGGTHFNGRVDEFRLASVARSAGWIATERNNQSNPTGFYTVSFEELIGDGRILPSTLLVNSDLAETYEEENPTRLNQNAITFNSEAEWDFVLQNNGAAASAYYCFRLVYANGAQLNDYLNYPRLVTNAPPLVPTLSAPFDNERFASTSPWFEFVADDQLGDRVAYQLQVSTDPNFSSTVIDNNSISNFALFTNLSQPSQKSTFTPGQVVRFIPTTALTNNTTYWWRVRAQDPDGSATQSAWSEPFSFTLDTTTNITTWFQTTAGQFATNNLVDTVANVSTNDVGLEATFTVGTTTSTVIDYDNRDTGNAWGNLSFNHNVTSGTIRYFVEYRLGDGTFVLVPNSVLPGNSTGFTSSPVSLVALDPTIYNELRIVSTFSGNSTFPRLLDWTVTWSRTIDIVTALQPFANAKVATTTPSFTFFTTDPENHDLQYELQLATNSAFNSPNTFTSGVNAGFVNTLTPADTSPFNSGNTISYTAQTALINGTTYWWRVRARDPGGSNLWSNYSEPRSFTVDTSITTSAWFQTTGEQFATNELNDIETIAGGARVADVVSEAMVAYAEGTGQAPQYRLWNGTAWSIAASAQSVGAQIRWLELRAAPTRPEYAVATLGTDLDVNIQIYNANTDTWGNLTEIQNNSVANNKRTFDIAYESQSGDLLAVACAGSNAWFSVWNGTTWTATSTLTLTNTNSCEYITMASDPISDEIIAVFRHLNAGVTDFAAVVWNGSTWGNAIALGSADNNTNEGMTVAYEESGNQAIVVVANSPSTNALFNIWNGSSWSGTATVALGDFIEWATLRPDVGTDRLALCYQDNDADIGVLFWSGSAWGTFTELTISANADNGRAVDCAFETTGVRDGHLVVAYSDTIASRYRTHDGTVFSAEITLSSIGDVSEVQVVRTGDGLVMMSGFDDGATPDRVDHSRWNGTTWTGLESFTLNSSLNTLAFFMGGSSLAPQVFPNITAGSIRSTSINFTDGTGPRWDQVAWNDTTPNASNILYRVYYQVSPGVFALVPNADLPGNSSGFTNSPIDISGLNRITYGVLQIEAELICVSGFCPSIQDWTVAWAEGITVSGNAREFDGVATTTSGTVAVAVNGVLQVGRTAPILSNGTWSIPNVTIFPNDTVAVYVDGAIENDEAVAVATYSGIGNLTNLELRKRHVTLGGTNISTTTNFGLIGFDNTNDEDILFTASGSGVVVMCAQVSCGDGALIIRAGAVYTPAANVSMAGFINNGTFLPATSTVRVAGNWSNQGNFTAGSSHVIFTATSSTLTITDATTTLRFNTLTFGETTGSAVWTINQPLVVDGAFTVSQGTLARSTSTITLANLLAIGAQGNMTGLGTTTFTGTGNVTWSDAKSVASSSNVGRVVIDGTAKTVTLAGSVGAESIMIGADDTLNAGGSGFNINVRGAWNNLNSFVPANGTVTFVGTSTNSINRGTSAFNNLAFTGVGGSWSFATSTLIINGDLTIATGTVTLPTGTTTIAGSFNNSGGTFLHNNSEVRMISNTPGRTITQRATAFLNNFHDLVFTGNGTWSFTESNATTSRDLRIQAGTVTFPTGTLAVGGDLAVTGTGAFSHNNGEILLLVQDNDTLQTNGSVINNLRLRGGSSASSWYNDQWANRVQITIDRTLVTTDLTDFPVYVNLADLPAGFFGAVRSDGGDIRVTQADGISEVPFELVSINTGARTGELHFRGNLASTTDTEFFIYYNNPTATGYSASAPFGSRNVWTNGFEAVYHLGTDPSSTILDSTSNARHLTPLGGLGPSNSVAGVLGNGIDLDGINDRLTNAGFAWTATPVTVTAWSNVATSEVQNSNLFGFTAAGSERLATHAPWGDNVIYWDYGTCCASPGRISTSYAPYLNKWTHLGLVSQGTGGSFMGIYLDGSLVTSITTADDPNVTLTGFSLGSTDPSGGTHFNGRVDEFRLASVARSAGWIATERNNQASTTNFYDVSGQQVKSTRNFIDNTVTIIGSYTAEVGGDAVFPTGVLAVGGSFDNNAVFNPNNGTVRFNSTAGSETIAAGSSSFATLEFNSATGNFTVTENATATTAINLTNVQQFTVNSGVTLASVGNFTNAVNSANTTWTGSTLRLASGGTVNLNARAHGGDTYGTLEAASSTLVRMWNSSAASYLTSGLSGAIYSQNHAGVNGNLHIFGNYRRTSGVEQWSANTDFDGTALGASARPVNVRFASSTVVTIASSSIVISGTSTATTTLAAISGAYELRFEQATVTAQFFSVADTVSSGLSLVSSTTLSVFRDASFLVNPGRTGITMDTSTIDTNPGAQFLRFNFATTSVGSANNVTRVGTTTANFVWFRNGTGSLYGEAFDAGDANPGSIRFDDSSNVINVSGVVYSDAGVTPQGAPVCDGVTPNVRIVVDGGVYTDQVPCNATTGAYTFVNVSYIGDPVIVVYLNTNGGLRGSAVTKTPTANITNLDLYANRVIVRHEDTAPLTIADMTIFDGDNDSDIAFFAATSSATNTLVTAANTELFVFANRSFAPGGEITLSGNGNSNGHEGTLALGANATFTASGTQTHRLAGRLVLNTGATLNAASSTFIFNATTTGKSITAPSTVTLHNVRFAGVGGGWNIGANLQILGDIEVATGTVTGTSDVTVRNGSLFGNGTLSLGGGTTTIERTNSFGGSSPWTLNNLVLGSGSVVGTTTPLGTATTTITGRFTIANAHFLNAVSSVWDLAGVGTVLVETGTLLEGASTIRYSGAGANVLSTTYFNLQLESGTGNQTYTAQGAGILVLNNLTVGGTASSTFDLNTNDVLTEVQGNLEVVNNGTLLASNSANLLVRGDFTNRGVFTANNGMVRFIGTSPTNIRAGNSAFANVDIDKVGNATVLENATATAAWRLINHNNFTVGSGQTLAVGGGFLNNIAGANTTFTGSTLSLFGVGTYTLNDSATSEQYASLVIASGTQARVWNTTVNSINVQTGGSLYSQDHQGVNGDLYIFGQLVRTTGDDYWSFATDFDGSDLTGGNERRANVYFANGASATWLGGSLSVLGTSTASTTIQNQGAGTYAITIGGTASTEWDRVIVRDTNLSGIVFSGTPTVTSFNNTDHLVNINNGTAITVFGSVINQNQARNFTGNRFAQSGGVTNPRNVTATGTAVSSWRFTNHTGNLAGEAHDSDPAGDPGYIVWDDSAALITVSGNVYSDEGTTVSTVCDGITPNIRLVVAGLTTYNTTCNPTTGAYSISNVAFSPLDTLTLFINGQTQRAVNVTMAPISSISNMHLYENRVIVRHENIDPITIDNMGVWDSDNDSDIPFTAVNGAPDTLTLPANTKLIVWNAKTFAPGGNVTVSGGGAGAPHDGTFEAQSNAVFRAAGTQTHTIGGSFIFGTGAQFVAASSTVTLTTTGATRTVDVNSDNLHNLTVTGAGSWSVTDPTLTLTGSYTQSAGTMTLPAGTTTAAAAFAVNGGSLNATTTPFVFTATSTGNTIRFNGATVGTLTFNGAGSWNMTDTNATSSGSVTISRGTVSLPSGAISVAGNFRNVGGAITHNTSDLIMRATTTATILASSSDLHTIRFVGGGVYTLQDNNLTLLDSFAVESGSVLIGTGTLAVGGSFTATGGSFTHASGTVLLNAPAGGRTINPGNNAFNNLQIGAPSGGYTLFSATTTNNFTIASVNSLTVNPGAVVTVGGVFTNSVGGAATTWTNTTLRLLAPLVYSINTRTNNGDLYGTLEIGPGAAVRSWYSAAATTTVATNSSLYSQDHNNINGRLQIQGNLTLATSTEHWSFATDFDGTSIVGSERVVTVEFTPNSTTTVISGTLNILGGVGNDTVIRNNGTGTYNLIIAGGTLNANRYQFRDMAIDGLQLLGLSTIADLANGRYELAVNTGSLITLSSTTLNANPSMIFDNVGFNATGSLSGFNVELVGTTINAWRFTNSFGTLNGEGFDIDGIDACGSIRFDNSSCLLTEQTQFRWRNNDGGVGVVNSEWYNLSWGQRKRVRILNNDNQAYASTAVKIIVNYENTMQPDFEDLRFTSDNGLTEIPFWIERYTASTEAQVWVRVPSLPASGYATVFMYYGNNSAVAAGSGTTTFVAFDDFEDNSLSEYSGDTTLFRTVTSPVFGGTRALGANPVTGRTTDGMFRFDQTIAQGNIIRYMQYVDAGASGNNDEPCFLFAVQSPGTTNQNYAVCLERFGVDRISLARNVENNDVSGVVLATTTVTYSTGWYEVEIDWRTDNTIFVSLFNSAGTLVATTSAVDSSYTSGGYGFAYWYQIGAWDSITARARVATRPTIFFGAEQTPGGASWLSAQNAAGNSIPNNVVRVRFAIENSGLGITGQQFRLEFAPRGSVATCESVASAAYLPVPNQASCDSSPICMATSSVVSNGLSTTDLLTATRGTFTAGRLVTSPSNQTGAIDISQNYYTEVEYAIVPTVNASDSYCFRVTNAGTPLDFYGEVAELGLQFDPSFGPVTLNNGINISLMPGTTTIVIASSTVTDLNGFGDITHATATIYRSGVGPACTPNDNNCYKLSTTNGGCTFTNCSGNSCTLRCAAGVKFFAEPTDSGAFDGQEWLAYVEVEDAANGYDFASAPGVELMTLRAITVDALINYGALEANTNTGSTNASTTIVNLGNVPVNIDVQATDLSDGISSIIPASQQKVATSTFTYGACVTCQQLSSSTPVILDINLGKPNTATPPVATSVFWGIAVPFGTNSAPHTGMNIFTPIGVN